MMSAEEPLTWEEALAAGRASTVFTTHTPVPAGIDRFRDLPDPALLRRRAGSGCPGGQDPGPGPGKLRGRQPVRLQHGGDGPPSGPARQRCRQAARRGLPRDVLRPLAGIRPFRGAHHLRHQRRACPDLGGPAHLEAGARAVRLRRRVPGPLGPRPTTSATRTSGRCAARCGCPWSRTSGAACGAAWKKRGAADAELAWTDSVLDPDILTIGFARRVPTYKRLTLMLREPERLKALLLHKTHPIQLVIAGKSHPADDAGKKMIQDLVRFTDDPQVRHRIVFLPNYDIAMARTLFPGCDVWLNNPLRPLEACGTSGHEGRPERFAEPFGAGRLVGRDVRRRKRLGDSDRQQRRLPRGTRRHRGGGALRAPRKAGGTPVLRADGGRRRRALPAPRSPGRRRSPPIGCR